MDYIIREMTKEEYSLLSDFLYEALWLARLLTEIDKIY